MQTLLRKSARRCWFAEIHPEQPLHERELDHNESWVHGAAEDRQICFTYRTRDGSMAGRVTDVETRSAFPRVNVSIVGTMQGPTTNADGSFRIDGLEAGTYDVHASPSRLGYTCYEQQGVVYRQR